MGDRPKEGTADASGPSSFSLHQFQALPLMLACQFLNKSSAGRSAELLTARDHGTACTLGGGCVLHLFRATAAWRGAGTHGECPKL